MPHEGEGPELVVGGGSLADLRADRKVKSVDFEQVFDRETNALKGAVICSNGLYNNSIITSLLSH